MKDTESVMTVRSRQVTDDNGNPIVFGQAPAVANRNPDLDHIINLFRKGADAIAGMDANALRQLGDTLLAVCDDNLTHDKLKSAPFWNDIDGFVDEHGYTLPSFASDEWSQPGSAAATTAGKIQYLANIIIPSCVSTMVLHLRQRLTPDEPSITDPDPTIDPRMDALNLRLLLRRLSSM